MSDALNNLILSQLDSGWTQVLLIGKGNKTQSKYVFWIKERESVNKKFAQSRRRYITRLTPWIRM